MKRRYQDHMSHMALVPNSTLKVISLQSHVMALMISPTPQEIQTWISGLL